MDREDLAELNTWWDAKLQTVEPTLKKSGITAAWWSFDVAQKQSGSAYETAIVDNAQDVNQCLAIIANTPRGGDPHRPTFASNVHEYLDWPIPQAQPYVVRELVQAVQRWEPRIQLGSLTVQPFKPSISSLTVNAEWSLAGLSEQTEIRVG